MLTARKRKSLRSIQRQVRRAIQNGQVKEYKSIIQLNGPRLFGLLDMQKYK